MLDWDGAEAASDLVLEQSTDPDFGTVLTRELGAAGATTVTGLANGEYYFRLASNGSPVSAPVRVSVAHHSLIRAGSFFVLGACLFGLLIAVILSGNRETAR